MYHLQKKLGTSDKCFEPSVSPPAGNPETDSTRAILMAREHPRLWLDVAIASCCSWFAANEQKCTQKCDAEFP